MYEPFVVLLNGNKIYLRGNAKIDYPQNAGRHSFSSYHVALHEDATKTAAAAASALRFPFVGV
jgi:hypothetical protein